MFYRGYHTYLFTITSDRYYHGFIRNKEDEVQFKTVHGVTASEWYSWVLHRGLSDSKLHTRNHCAILSSYLIVHYTGKIFSPPGTTLKTLVRHQRFLSGATVLEKWIGSSSCKTLLQSKTWQYPSGHSLHTSHPLPSKYTRLLDFTFPESNSNDTQVTNGVRVGKEAGGCQVWGWYWSNNKGWSLGWAPFTYRRTQIQREVPKRSNNTLPKMRHC